MKLKIKAFTMLEALISLILTGIIITLSYSLFTLVNKQMVLFEKENVEIINYNLLNATLLNDINQSNNFNFENEQLVLKNYTKPDIIYQFNNQFITRTIKNADLDSFRIRSFNRQYSGNTESAQNQLNLSLKILNDTISASYFLKQQNSSIINKNLFNED